MVKNYSDFREGSGYIAPECHEIRMAVEGAILTASGALKEANVVNGFVEYIARKTKENRPVTVRVPLNDVAKSMLEKYKDLPGLQLLPFTSQQ